MRKLVFFAAVVAAFATAATVATPAFAQASDEPCAAGIAKFGPGVNNLQEGTQPEGSNVVIAGATVTVTGFSGQVCVKAGQNKYEFTAPGTFVTPTGQDVSHIVLFAPTGTTGEETTGEETTGEETTGEETTGEETTGEETTGEETTGAETTGEETTGGEGGAGGGGGGGEAVGEAPAEEASGELPFTGFPVWIMGLAGLGLVGAGLAFWRAARSGN
jgi:hypothetical protein